MNPRSWRSALTRAARQALAAMRRTDPAAKPRRGTASPPGRPTPDALPRGTRDSRAHYPGDFAGIVRPEYSPSIDGDADPGEIVWTRVPYEEDFSRGKDRPVLVIGRDGDWLLGLMLTSKDHSRDQADEARAGRRWLDIGSGSWDSRGRESEVRLDRVIRIDPLTVRREGAVMERSVFDAVLRGLAE